VPPAPDRIARCCNTIRNACPSFWSLAAYTVPKTVEFVDQIPRTAATKVNRSAMIGARTADHISGGPGLR
jgi:acyl-CoA synthetase (AMP-forming)/AMP-acid ligase II